MSWGWIAAGVVAVGAAYYFSEKEKTAKRNYERKEREYSRTVKKANRDVEKFMKSEQFKQQRAELKLAYQRAKQAADSVYIGARDGKLAIAGFNRAIKQLMQRKTAIKKQLETVTGAVRREAFAEIKLVNEVLTSTYAERDSHQSSIDALYVQLKQLNQATASLKLQLQKL